ncbi:MAG TPA: CDP-diacylglycerol--serine O-phosphatidyltransferase [candidate division Zixibacteria bacterium]|jgi:CDP-diacylglycerol--serine O-phosphatidyltransferase
MRNFKGIFPGVFTVGNMLCGFISILQSFEGEAIHAAWLIILAGFFDALDGKIARISRSASRFGIELDSFADFVSFGIAPAVIFYSFRLYVLGTWGWLLGFLFIICGAFRLARFNIEARLEEKPYFTGLPIPVAAITLCGYTLFSYELWGELLYPEVLITLVIVFSALMVSGIEYETLPRFSLNSKKNLIKLIYILVALIAVLLKPRLAIFPLGMIYVLSGIVREVYQLVHMEPKNEKLVDK